MRFGEVEAEGRRASQNNADFNDSHGRLHHLMAENGRATAIVPAFFIAATLSTLVRSVAQLRRVLRRRRRGWEARSCGLHRSGRVELKGLAQAGLEQMVPIDELVRGARPFPDRTSYRRRGHLAFHDQDFEARSGFPLRFVEAISVSSFSLIDSAISLDAPFNFLAL